MANSHEEEDGTILTLLDEDGNEQAFEHLASLEYNGSNYLALVPYYEKPEDLVEADGELVILKTIEENGEDLLTSVDDDEEFEAVSRQFEQMLSDRYEIDDEDEEDDQDGQI